MLDIPQKDNHALALVHIYDALNAATLLFCDRLEARAGMMRRSKVDKSSSVKKMHERRVIEIAATAKKRLGIIDLQDVPGAIVSFKRFLKSFVERDYYQLDDYASAIAHKTASECLTYVEKLYSLNHIALAHSADAIKRAQRIEEEIKKQI